MSTDRIEKKILLHAPLNRVWRAIADSAEFGSWFGMNFEGSFEAGATVRGTIVPTMADEAVAASQKPYEGFPVELTIERIEPKRLLSFRWHPFALEPGVDYANEPTTLVVFELEETPEGVRLTVTESGFDGIPADRRAKAFDANEAGWGMVMGLIEKHLAQ